MDLILVGAGRTAHNFLGLVEDAGWTVPYLLDDQPSSALFGRPVRDLATHAGPVWDALLCVGEPAARQSIVERTSPHGRLQWQSFRHPSAVISRYAELGAGTFAAPFVTMADVSIGQHAMVFPFTQLGSRVRLGAFSVVASHCSINSEVEIGKGCLIGSGARITAGVRIGDDCRVTAGAVVRKDIPAGSIVTVDGRFRSIRRTSVAMPANAAG